MRRSQRVPILGSAPAAYTPIKLGIINNAEPSAAHTEEANAKIAPRRVDYFVTYRGTNQSIAFGGDKTGADSVGAQLSIAYATAAGAQGTAADGTLGNLATGVLDSTLASAAENIKAYGKEVLIRLCWEMNGNWMAYGNTKETPAKYIEGWKYFFDFLAAHGATNIKKIWCPNVWGLGSPSVVDPTPYYPGDAYVDFIGYDGYMTKANPSVLTPAELFGPSVAATSAISSKPKMINEVGVATDARLSKPAWITQLGAYAKTAGLAGLTYWSRSLSETQGDATLGVDDWAAFKAMVNNPNFK